MENLISINSLKKSEISGLLKTASEYNLRFVSNELSHKKIALAFFEASTRTKLSFEIAAKNLGVEVIDFMPDLSSIQKGESLIDTLKTIQYMGVDAFVIRHSQEGSIKMLSEHLDVPVINAGDGSNQHPTQALLDALTLKDSFGNLEELHITICGDIAHSRVARSNIHLFEMFGVNFSLCGPSQLITDEFAHINHFSNIDEAVEKSDVIMTLRIQKERMEKSEVPDEDKYFKKFGFKKSHFDTNSNIFLMHPGPVNYGIEVEAGIQNYNRCLIDRQVSNGVLLRMAVIKHLLNQS